ncbi:MAG: hypothetical protein ACTSRG_00550 [Candidatus Helarchaeota archaeon]
MIIIHLDDLNDFASFLEKRISNEIFFEFIKPEPELNGLKVQLQYLGVMNNTNILFTTHLDFPKIKDKEAVKNKLKEIKISELDLRLVHGKIRELYISIS